MRCLILLLATAFFALFAGRGEAGEDEYLLLRGGSGDGGIQVNEFFAPARKADAPSATVCPEGYLQWKNRCAASSIPSEPADGGQRVPLGFAQVTPYLERRVREERGYLDLLADELPSVRPALPSALFP